MHQGGVTLAYKNNKHWHIESPKSFGDNVLKCTLVHGCQRTILIGIYIPPSEDNMETINNLDRAVHNVDQKNLVILGDFSFHRQAVRYLTNTHIQKLNNGQWVHPTHDPLFRKCGIFPINIYIKRRRGTLHQYLEKNRAELLQKAENCSKHSLNVHKVMWWKQPYLTKRDMDHTGYWYN